MSHADQRSAWLAVILTAVLTGLVVGSGTYLWQQEKRARDIAAGQSDIDRLEEQLSNLKKTASPSPQATGQVRNEGHDKPEASPQSAVESFYKEYIALRGTNTKAEQDLFKNQLTNQLIGKIADFRKQDRTGIDPVVCLTEKPASVRTVSKLPLDMEDTLVTKAAFGIVSDLQEQRAAQTGQTLKPVQVNMDWDGTQWRLSDIICP